MSEFGHDNLERSEMCRPFHAVVIETFKPRDQHRGQQMPHLGQSHIEKDRLESAAKALDQGPTFVMPDARTAPGDAVSGEVNLAFADVNQEINVARSG